MRGMRVVVILLGLFVAGSAASVPAADRVTVESVLAEMDNLAALAELPDPPFTCKQFSSYDRASVSPDDPKTWFANGDRGKYLRTELHNGEKEFVMADMEGPGCIVRIWSANAGGMLRIYIDGDEKPALEMKMQDAMDGKHEPFLAPFAGVHSRGWNLYFPFPYARHCKVTTTDGDIYYHVNYRTYPAGTAVESFKMDQIAPLKDKMTPVGRRLAKPYASDLWPDNAKTQQIKLFELAPGASKVIAEIKGPAAIFEFQAILNSEKRRQALRHVILEIAFDGEKPQVVCPLGDFFGSSPDINPYESLPLMIHSSGEMRSKWFMPFAKSCTIKVTNRGSETADFEGVVTTVPYRWSDRSMYFHAKWRAENNMRTRPFHDWTFVKCEGLGVFVGDMLSVANPVKGWWGEGDEKIYVDGEKFPSHFGTGSEDYFGYAWCCPDLFTHCYHNQSRCDGPGNYGLTSVNRFHVIDKIPFTRQFQFDIEAWHSNANTTVSYNATSYWYARPGGKDFYKPLSREMLRVIEVPLLPVAAPVKGALEGEALKIVQRSGGTTEVQEGFEELWSGHKQLWWKAGKPGDTLILAFPVKEAGRYNVFANFTRAADYGVIQLSINDEKLGAPMDFYHDGVTSTGRKPLGTVELKKGENQLKAEITGKNAKASPGHMFGLDYLSLEKAK